MSGEVERLREAAEKATPGPWFKGRGKRSDHGPYTIWGPDGIDGGTIADCNGATLAFRDDNAAFIALANPQTVLALLAENARLREAAGPFEAFSRSIFPNCSDDARICASATGDVSAGDFRALAQALNTQEGEGSSGAERRGSPPLRAAKSESGEGR